MNLSKHSLITAAVLTLLTYFLLVSPSYAQYYDGGSVELDWLVDKQVLNPDTGEFVENLSFDDHLFVSGEEITFRLRAHNTGTVVIENIHVEDVLPSELEWVRGQSLPFAINRLEVGEVREYEFVARVREDSHQGDYCVVNRVIATRDSEQKADTAQICFDFPGEIVEEDGEVLGVTTLPKTGVDDNLLIMGMSLLLYFVGLYIVIKANKTNSKGGETE